MGLAAKRGLNVTMMAAIASLFAKRRKCFVRRDHGGGPKWRRHTTVTEVSRSLQTRSEQNVQAWKHRISYYPRLSSAPATQSILVLSRRRPICRSNTNLYYHAPVAKFDHAPRLFDTSIHCFRLRGHCPSVLSARARCCSAGDFRHSRAAIDGEVIVSASIGLALVYESQTRWRGATIRS